MGMIFGRQGRSIEVYDLWNAPPEHLRPLVSRHSDDLRTLTMGLLRQNKRWQQLTEHCLTTIRATQSCLEIASTPKSKLWELCAWNWQVWRALVDSLWASRPYPE